MGFLFPCTLCSHWSYTWQLDPPAMLRWGPARAICAAICARATCMQFLSGFWQWWQWFVDVRSVDAKMGVFANGCTLQRATWMGETVINHDDKTMMMNYKIWGNHGIQTICRRSPYAQTLRNFDQICTSLYDDWIWDAPTCNARSTRRPELRSMCSIVKDMASLRPRSTRKFLV